MAKKHSISVAMSGALVMGLASSSLAAEPSTHGNKVAPISPKLEMGANHFSHLKLSPNLTSEGRNFEDTLLEPAVSTSPSDGQLDSTPPDPVTVTVYELPSAPNVTLNSSDPTNNAELHLSADTCLGIHSFKVTETATKPEAGEAGWKHCDTGSGQLSFSHTLSDQADGEKTVYVWFRWGASGEKVLPIARTIQTTLDTSAEVQFVSSAPVNLLNRAAYTVSGICSDEGGSITVHVESSFSSNFNQTSAATCETGGLWSVVFNFSSIPGDSILYLSAEHTDLLGNLATPASTTINLDVTPPTLTIATPNRTLVREGSAGATRYTLATDGTFSRLTTEDVTLATTGTASCTVSVGRTPEIPTIDLTFCTGDGTIRFRLAAGTAVDNSGNASALSEQSATLTVDYTAP